MRSHIKFFALVDRRYPDRFITICNKKKDIAEFLKIFVTLKNFDHFVSWCELRNKNPKDFATIEEYFYTCIPADELKYYQTKKIGYTKDGICSILRMFCGCAPIGCSFDSNVEYTYFENKTKQVAAIRKEVENILAEKGENNGTK